MSWVNKKRKMIITRRIEVFVCESDKGLRKEYYDKLYKIRDVARDAANAATSHLFILDNSIPYLDEGSKAFIKVLLTQNLSGRILDVGCGYGPIGLVLASFIPHGEFLLIDVNARACMLARENAKNMNLSNVRVVESDIYQNVTGMFDNIVTNPPIRAGKKVIYKIYMVL